jgi:hypothetical protein
MPGSDPSIVISLLQGRVSMDDYDGFEFENEEKICSLSGSGDQIDLDLIKSLVKDSRYVCCTCGRSAANAERVCSPEIL